MFFFRHPSGLGKTGEEIGGGNGNIQPNNKYIHKSLFFMANVLYLRISSIFSLQGILHYIIITEFMNRVGLFEKFSKYLNKYDLTGQSSRQAHGAPPPQVINALFPHFQLLVPWISKVNTILNKKIKAKNPL